MVHSTKGIVSSTQPLAAKCGIDILNAGGNAAVSLLPRSQLVNLDPVLTWSLGRGSGCWYGPSYLLGDFPI